PQQRLASLGMLQVERGAALVAVDRQKRLAYRSREWWHGPRVVARPRLLDLEHVGAEVGEHLAGVAAGQEPCQIEHAHTSQRRRRSLGHIGQSFSGDTARYRWERSAPGKIPARKKGAGHMVLRGAIRPERRSTFPAATVIPESPILVNPPNGDERPQRLSRNAQEHASR